ncbi:RCC1/BLIP-II [Ascobolus immersus RN42]|uniref:RCC1/BLIP-II n=1 Tax=Ascobolus immersus RN42 TaxID=1160509 RepID=A0A3N4IBW1_ASCIM|nr:RCC1/BLIP-II [Ascobolus immersus RN42]
MAPIHQKKPKGLRILDLPTDLLVDCILPLLPLHDFINFTSTCRGFHRLSNDEVYFRNLTYKTFRFPAQPLRKEGWKQLFKQIATARLFTWGAAGENRLGHSWPVRSYETRGAKYPTEPKLNGVEGMVVDIAVGGWSTTVLTSAGVAYTTGQIRESGGGPTDGFERLKYPSQETTKLAQISSGRDYILALDDENQLWKWDRNGGKPGELVPIGLPRDELYRIRNIRAGFYKFAVFIEGYGICHGDLSNLDEAKVPGTNGTQPADPKSPTLEGKIGRVVEYMVLENHLLFLSEAGALYAKHLQRNDPPVLLPNFTAREGEEPLCYLSGAFRNFAVFNKSGLVLLGNDGMLEALSNPAGEYAQGVSSTYDLTAPLIPKEEIKPLFRDSLQKKGIIKISFGDWHSLALTESGKVLTWGRESQGCGCFGIGPANSEEAKAKGVATTGPGGWDADLKDPAEVDFFVPSQLEDEDRNKWTKNSENASFFAFNIEAAGWHSGALVSCPVGFPRVYSKLAELPRPTSFEPPERNPVAIFGRRFLARFGGGQDMQSTQEPPQYTGPSTGPARVSVDINTAPPQTQQQQQQDAEVLDESYVDPDAIGDDDEMNYEEISDDDFAVQNHALHPPRPTRTSDNTSSNNNENGNNPPPPQPRAAPSSSSSHPNPNPDVQYAPDDAPRYEISDQAAMNPFMMPFIRGGLGPVIPQGNGPNAQPTRTDSGNQGGPEGDRYGHAQGNAGTDGSA